MSESVRFALAMVAFALMATLLAIGMSPPSATWIPARRPYPRLTAAQKDRVLAELLQEYRLDNLRPVREGRGPAPREEARA